MAEFKWFVLDVNPEPWAVGPVTTGRRGGKIFGTIGRNAQLHAYQEGVRSALGSGHEMITGPVEIKFYFWRSRADYKTHQARTVRKNEADVTNMQKATEDALQGILFKNDKDTNCITSKIIEQGPDVTGKIVIGVRAGAFGSMLLHDLPDEVMEQIAELNTFSPSAQFNESWSPDDDEEDEFL
jgi:Holliday junction resolvase RusA-like endonuclease